MVRWPSTSPCVRRFAVECCSAAPSQRQTLLLVQALEPAQKRQRVQALEPAQERQRALERRRVQAPQRVRAPQLAQTQQELERLQPSGPE